MRLKLTLNRAGQKGPGEDILVTLDTTVSVGELAQTIARCDPRRVAPPSSGELSLRIDGHETRELPHQANVVDAGLYSGQEISLVAGGIRFSDAKLDTAAATLVVLGGPDAGRQFPLHVGANQVGRARGNEVRLTDPLVSKQHARNVGETVEIIDLGSSNGLFVDQDRVARTVLRANDVVILGDTSIRVELHAAPLGMATPLPAVHYNRSPRLDRVFEGAKVSAPDPPKRAQKSRFPLIPMLAPLAVGAILYLVTRQILTVLFVGLSPLFMIGSVLEGRIGGKRSHQDEMADYQAAMSELSTEMTRLTDEEIAVRLGEHPSTADAIAAAVSRSPLLSGRCGRISAASSTSVSGLGGPVPARASNSPR